MKDERNAWIGAKGGDRRWRCGRVHVGVCAYMGVRKGRWVLDRYCRLAEHSRFMGVARVFQTGTISTLGREVNWKSMGASVDRSDCECCAIQSRAGWQTRVEKEPV